MAPNLTIHYIEHQINALCFLKTGTFPKYIVSVMKNEIPILIVVLADAIIIANTDSFPTLPD